MSFSYFNIHIADKDSINDLQIQVPITTSSQQECTLGVKRDNVWSNYYIGMKMSGSSLERFEGIRLVYLKEKILAEKGEWAYKLLIEFVRNLYQYTNFPIGISLSYALYSNYEDMLIGLPKLIKFQPKDITHIEVVVSKRPSATDTFLFNTKFLP